MPATLSFIVEKDEAVKPENAPENAPGSAPRGTPTKQKKNAKEPQGSAELEIEESKGGERAGSDSKRRKSVRI